MDPLYRATEGAVLLTGLEIVAEWGQTHGGDVKVAIWQAKTTALIGAQIAKFQIFDPARLASMEAKRYWDTALGGSHSQLDTFTDNGMLTPKEWLKVANACERHGVEFCATPFDMEAVDLLEALEVRTYKLASGDLTYQHLIEKIAATGKRCLMSTGASTLSEVERAIEWFERASPPPQDLQRRDWTPHENLVLLACDLQYPTEKASLGKIRKLAEYGRPVGYSDHTLGVETGELAVCAGATVLEKHCTLNPGGDVPDDRMALDVDAMRDYIDRARAAVDANSEFLGKHEQAARVGARRSLYTRRALRAGERIQAEDIVFLRPCPRGAWQPFEVDMVIGRRVACDIPEGDRIAAEHVIQHESQACIAA
mgnify:CR=1 FL=1